VVLHVARVRRVVVVLELAAELIEQLVRRFAHRVDEHVQAAAVGHADHHVTHAVAAAALDQGVHQRDQRVAAFQRETLLAHEGGVKVALKALGGGDALEQALLFLGLEAVLAGRALEALLHPAALVGVGDVHELGADAAGVRRAQLGQQVGQLELLFGEPGVGGELARQVGVGEAVERQVEVGRVLLGHHGQRVELGAEVAARAVGGDQLADGRLLARGLVVHAAAGPAGPGRCLDAGHHRRVRDVAGFPALEAVEVGFPGRGNAVGIDQVLLVQVFDIGGVAAGKLRGLLKLLDQTVHDPGLARRNGR